MSKFIKYFKQEDGATAIEYGLIAGLLSLVIVVGLLIAGPELEGIFQDIGADLTAANAAS